MEYRSTELARVQYVVDNYTNIAEGKRSEHYRNSDGSYAKTIVLQTRVDDGYYYVVEAVPDSKKKTLMITSAFKNKKDILSEGVHVENDPNRNVQDAAQQNISSIDSIPRSEENVTKKYSIDVDNLNNSAKEDVKKAEEYFGTTYKINEAGYLLLDGKLLDFSGKHEGAPGGYRSVDHREIIDAFDGDYGDGSHSGGMIQFMQAGNIRLSPESGGINLAVKPNKAQISALDRYIANFRGEVILDIDDENGNTVVSVEYPSRTYSKRVINDINDYFDKGIIPESPSTLGQFRYSINIDDALFNALEDTYSEQEQGDASIVQQGFEKNDRAKMEYRSTESRRLFILQKRTNGQLKMVRIIRIV